jgi:hypothetical protein
MVTKFSHAHPTLLQTSCGSFERFIAPSFNHPLTELGDTLYLTVSNLSLITCQNKRSITLFLVVVAVVTVKLGLEVTLNLVTDKDITFLDQKPRVAIAVTSIIEETKDAGVFQTHFNQILNLIDVVHVHCCDVLSSGV